MHSKYKNYNHWPNNSHRDQRNSAFAKEKASKHTFLLALRSRTHQCIQGKCQYFLQHKPYIPKPSMSCTCLPHRCVFLQGKCILRFPMLLRDQSILNTSWNFGESTKSNRQWSKDYNYLRSWAFRRRVDTCTYFKFSLHSHQCMLNILLPSYNFNTQLYHNHFQSLLSFFLLTCLCYWPLLINIIFTFWILFLFKRKGKALKSENKHHDQ